MNFELLETWDKWLLVISSFSVVKIVFLKKHPVISAAAKDAPKTYANPPIFGPGLSSVPGGNSYLNRTVFSWHYYCPIIGYSGNDEPMDPAVKYDM
jgi:hypothetical protein